MADTEKENSSAESKKKSAMLDEDFGKKSRKCADSNASDCSFKHVKNQDSRSNSETSTDAFKDLENKKPLMPSHQNGSMTESIDRDTDHQGWLQLKKRKRREIPEERKRRRLGNRGKPSQAVGATKLPQSVSSCRRDQDKNGVSLFFRKHEFPLIMSHWQIIQLVSSTHPGRFFAWVIADGIMKKISITVPRVFYLNSKTPVTEEFPGRRVNKILPHSRPVFNLTEICIDEDLFRAESRKLAIHLAVPEVEGIYETKVPLEFNAILQIGCVCKVDKTARVRNVQDGWNMSELQMKTTAECSYLEKGIPFFYLYHSFLEGRGIYIAYIAVSSTISAIVVDPFQNKELSSSLLEKQFHEACQALSIDPPAPGSCITFKVDYVKSIEAGEQHLQRALTEFSYCNDCRDLELRRGSSLLDQEWRCAVPQCGQPYNREHMENALLQIVRQRERLYHLQDLVCLRCKQVKGALLAEQCVCGGLFRCNESASEFQSKMLVFRDISIRQKFQLLQDCTSWILEVQANQ